MNESMVSSCAELELRKLIVWLVGIWKESRFVAAAAALLLYERRCHNSVTTPLSTSNICGTYIAGLLRCRSVPYWYRVRQQVRVLGRPKPRYVGLKFNARSFVRLLHLCIWELALTGRTQPPRPTKSHSRVVDRDCCGLVTSTNQSRVPPPLPALLLGRVAWW